MSRKESKTVYLETSSLRISLVVARRSLVRLYSTEEKRGDCSLPLWGCSLQKELPFALC